MAELTKEEQIQAIYDLKVGYTLGHADIAMLKSMARQLLASMKQEPVAYMHHSGQVVTREECCDDKIFAICCKVETPLYSAPQLPQPAVPDDIARRIPEILRTGKANRWEIQALAKACRAAMLQGAEPVSQGDELPEWLQQAHKLAELHGCSFVVFRHGEEAQCADPTKVIISFTDEGLGHHSAAPQQEVKR